MVSKNGLKCLKTVSRVRYSLWWTDSETMISEMKTMNERNPQRSVRKIQSVKWCKYYSRKLLGQANVATLKSCYQSQDFDIWSILEKAVSSLSHLNFDSLKAAIHSALTKWDEKLVRLSCVSGKTRFRLMIKAKGGHVEI